MTKEDRPGPRVDRRRFLQLAGTSAGVVALPGVSPGDEEAFDALAQAAGDGPSGSVRLLRPRDLLNLEIDFLNLEPRPRFLDAPGLHAIDASKPSFLIVTLPGQHLLEARTAESDPAPPLPVGAFLSDHTTLVFRVPHALLPLDYLIESLMRWQEFELVVRPPGRPMCEPRHETAIVFPSRLSFVPANRRGSARRSDRAFSTGARSSGRRASTTRR